jgi:hypothetical protein
MNTALKNTASKNTAKIALIACAAVIVMTLAGCTDSATTKDQQSTDSQLSRYQSNQPIPSADFSQYRQTIIDVENAQIHGVATTSFFFNQGTPNPVKSCPSIGFAVPSTSQLTNPEQIAYSGSGSGGYGVISQMEPNGSYTGHSTGTNVICVAANGTKYISYWEGVVGTEGGPAHWDRTQGLIVMDGEPTVVAKTSK